MPGDSVEGTKSEDLKGGQLPSTSLEQLPLTVGTEFILRFYRLLKGATLYDRNNANIERLT